MKEYYQQRFYWMFHYTSKKFWYCVAKTLCIIVGAPIYSVMFLVEMLLTAINLIFSWIPIVRIVIMVICKSLIWLVGKTFYISILTDLKAYKNAMAQVVDYVVEDHPDGAADVQYEDVSESVDALNASEE